VGEVRFEGDRMVLIPPPRTSEIKEYRKITWQHIAAV
jgi:hypothetical protein